MKAIFLIALGVAFGLTSSCNTFIGMGRDMRITGEGMEKSASKAQGQTTRGNSNNSADTSGAPVY